MELTERIIGAAMAVHRELGPGLDEKIYENALCLEFVDHQILFSQQSRYPVFYRGRIVGTLIPDPIVEEKVVVETKVAEAIAPIHVAQTLSYLAVTGIQIGLILNFKLESLVFKRVARLHQDPNPS
jgi:GxxExxY protein